MAVQVRARVFHVPASFDDLQPVLWRAGAHHASHLVDCTTA
jgi:hypothetical protein